MKAKLEKWRVSVYVNNRLDGLIHGQEVKDGTQIDSSLYDGSGDGKKLAGVLLMAAHSVCRNEEIKAEIGLVMAKVTNPVRGSLFDQPDLPWGSDDDETPPDVFGF